MDTLRLPTTFSNKKSRSVARNYLVPKVKESLIAYVDADVVLDVDWLYHCVQGIKGWGVGAVEGSIYRVGESFIDEVRRDISRRGCRNFNMLEPIEGIPTLNAATMLIKKDCLERVGLFDPELKRYEDTDLTYRLFLARIHLASISLAKSYVSVSDTLFSYLLLRPVVMGYFQARSLAKYNPLPLKGLFRYLLTYWKELVSQKNCRHFFVTICTVWTRFLIFSWLSYCHWGGG